VSKPTTYDEPSWTLYNKLLYLGVSVDEATALMNGYAHELAERQRAEGASWGQDSAAGKVYRAAADLIDPAVSGEQPGTRSST
jgi:hypothetical protein